MIPLALQLSAPECRLSANHNRRIGIGIVYLHPRTLAVLHLCTYYYDFLFDIRLFHSKLEYILFHSILPTSIRGDDYLHTRVRQFGMRYGWLTGRGNSFHLAHNHRIVFLIQKGRSRLAGNNAPILTSWDEPKMSAALQTQFYFRRPF
jgi:hypothetical protein